jgi:hypothetical protein
VAQLFALCCVQGRNLWPAAYALRWAPWLGAAPGIELVDSGAKLASADSGPKPGSGTGGAAAAEAEEGSEEASRSPEPTRRKRRFLQPKDSFSDGHQEALVMDLPFKAHLPEVREARCRRRAAAWHGTAARTDGKMAVASAVVCLCGRGGGGGGQLSRG